MARGEHDDPVSPRPIPRKVDEEDGIGQQRRIELEQEVAMLQEMLENEEKVHQVLEQAVIPGTNGSCLRIPSFLPKKVKELLAEVVMVEEEISRLEEEIRKNKQDLQDRQEGRGQTTLKSTQEKQETIGSTEPIKQLSRHMISSTEDKAIQEKLALETRSLFFLNQAIKGDYPMHSFTHKEKNGRVVENKSVKGRQRALELHERSPRRGGIVKKPLANLIVEKPISPKMPLMHPVFRQPKPIKEISSNILRESPSIDSSLKKNHHKWQPNNLSEKIMKCLICIFLRLIRTSRVMELEKSGNSLKTGNVSSRSGSFRADASLFLKASFNTQRETSQQDPYGIFEIEDSIVRDIGPYKNNVKFTLSYLEVKGISGSLPLLSKLRVLLNELHEVDLRDLTHHQKLAFWINMHNTCIMHGFLEYGFPTNPQKVIAVRNKAVINVGGNILNALDIENFILRQSSNTMEGDKHDKEDAVRSIYGLLQSEPNVSFALCCGNKSSPALKIYTADSVSTELEKSKVEYLQASIVVTPKRLMIPKLLLLNMHDFAEDLFSLLEWIGQQLPTSGSLRKCITEGQRVRTNQKISDIVDILPYNFEFQYLLPL